MHDTRVLLFAPFRLDLGSERLWRGEEAVRLTAKAFAVLRYLVDHANRLVTKDELIDAVWALPAVSEAALSVCIGEIRRALQDSAQSPQFLETVRGRGYRFLAPVTLATRTTSQKPTAALPHDTVLAPETPPLLVGREAELAQLRQCWTQAQQGRRQIVFVTGEAGIGKTSLVDALVAQVGATDAAWIGRGQCIEQYGAGEAYLPLFEILGQMGQGPYGAQLVEVLAQQAPNWLLQMPRLLPSAAVEAVQRRASGATQERMLRELAEMVETLTMDRSLLLVLEDLHWSDVSTLNWLAYMARRRQAARLLVVGTYRPTDALVHGHPVHTVTQDLILHGQGMEMVLGYLTAEGVAAYLMQRFSAAAPPEVLVQALHQRTDGHPFFLVTVVNELVRQGGLRQEATGWKLVGSLEAVAIGIPASIHQAITQQVERCAPEAQAVLEAASVAGIEFSAVAVAAGMEQTVETVEAHCDAFVRREQFLQALHPADWPDGTVTARYRFRHDLYREVLYGRVPVSRRVRWHRQIGLRLEAGYGPQTPELAAELAEHFVRGRDTERAVQYLWYAGEQAVQRSAHQEALGHLTKGLELLSTLPETPARAQQELDLQLALGPVLIAIKGIAVPEVEQTYARARELCEQVGETPQIFLALWGLCLFYQNRGALLIARELGEQLDRLAQHAAAPTSRLEAHDVLGNILFYLGDYAAARTHLERGIALTDPATQWALALRHDVALGVTCLAVTALTLWCLGFPEQAVRRSQEALTLAQELSHPHSLAVAQHFAASLHHRRREAAAVEAQADALLLLASGQGFPLWVGCGTCWRGWALVMQGQGEAGMAQMRQGLTALLDTGMELSRPLWLLLLAEAAEHTGQIVEGLRLLAEALAAFEASGRGDMLTEAYRLQGAFLLRQAVPDVAQAEACFQQSLALARHQQAKSWELRAALSLSRLWQRQGKCAEAYDLLAPIYGWFTEGFDTTDLQEAKALLEELRT